MLIAAAISSVRHDVNTGERNNEHKYTSNEENNQGNRLYWKTEQEDDPNSTFQMQMSGYSLKANSQMAHHFNERRTKQNSKRIQVKE